MRRLTAARSPWLAARRLLVAWLLLVGAALPAAAHKSSDAYLQLDASPGHLALRWDIALRDLDVALDLDADHDGQLSWGEVKAAWPRIDAYASARLAIDGCALRPPGGGSAAAPALERRNDGAYVVLRRIADCDLPDPPAIRYGLFAEVDPTHRGIAKVARPNRPLALAMLDPSASGGPAPEPVAASSAPAAAAPAAPSRLQFLGEGVRHILTGYDHVLFLVCLLLPAVLRRDGRGWQPVARLGEAIWPVVGIVSAFTVAHSLTLGLAALKLVAIPSAVIEPAIAVTILLAALDNLRPVFPVPRVVVTFAFGLIHGFGFAGVLSELDLPTADFAWALLQFNLGLECGQLLIVLLVTGLLYRLRRWRGYRPAVLYGGSGLAAALAVAWFVERVAHLKFLPI